MQEQLTKFSKQETDIPRPLYSLERENELLHDMVREIALERNAYRIKNQRLMDEVARLRRVVCNENTRLKLITQSYGHFFRTGDIEHLKDVERILEYDGLGEFEE